MNADVPVLATMPDALKATSQWVCWRAEDRDGKSTKVPYTASGTFASSTNPATWCDPQTALDVVNAGRAHGIGFVFTPTDAYVGIDLDKAIDDEGAIADWALAILDRFPTYREYSPSGRGIHIIAVGSLPGPGRKTPHVEMYDRGRYFTMTGRRLGTHEIADCSAEVLKLYEELAPAAKVNGNGHRPTSVGTAGSSALDDHAVIDRALQADNSAKFSALWAGDIAGYPSPSEATAALLNMLAFWTNRDAAQMDRLFRQSGLMREKWDGKRGQRTWGDEEIERAIQRTTETYEPSGRVLINGKARANEPKSDETELTELSATPWPDDPDPAIYHGILGELVQTIEPYTEADPIAILAQALVLFGNAIGRGPHFIAEGSRHYTNLYVALVGVTAKGRKGSAYAHARRIGLLCDEQWTANRQQSGLSSGEGLIWAVRDPINVRERQIKKGESGQYKSVESDPGVSDKRLLVFEGEFASALKAIGRQGNTLSTVLRQAWDDGNLNTMVKNSPAKATNAHISVIGHVTRDELLRDMQATETSNGFANRFLWFCVRRSKYLPDGDAAEHIDLRPYANELWRVVTTARGIGLMHRDEQARELWHSVYPALSDGKRGLLGLVTSRAEAQVMRLACTYALLDESALITIEHLRAALGLWDYSEASCHWIFGDSLGDPTADEIVKAITANGGTLTRYEIRRLFNGHKSKLEIDQALSLLYRNGILTRITETTGGRPAETWALKGGSQ